MLRYWLCRVYPRVCGEADIVLAVVEVAVGLPPRVRGSPSVRLSDGLPSRSTPACAGKPQIELTRSGASRVYPRVCGEAGYARAVRQPEYGLPPRVRGSQRRRQRIHGRRRSTPACAGKPYDTGHYASAGAVYPRVCGEASRF